MTAKTRTSLFLLTVFLIATGYFIVTAGGKDKGFRWVSENKGETVSEVVIGSARIVPFEFIVGEGVSKVKITIENEELRKMGIFLDEETLSVENGRVSSKAYFSLKEGTPARRYDLEITARDAATGRVVGKGTIPFAVFPYFYNVLKCSC